MAFHPLATTNFESTATHPSMKTTSSDAKTAGQIRAYLAAQPSKTRAVLKQMRDAIKSVAPDAVDSFSYRIPGVKLDGKALVWYAGFTHHASLYPIGDAIRTRYRSSLEGYETSKGTVRFPLDKPLPLTLVKRLVKARVEQVRGTFQRPS
jgi:uncharacterized protein YdhG (YjbR/CyaY superfamily)